MKKIILAALALSSSVGAMSPRDIPLKEQADRADIVVTAEAEKILTCNHARFRDTCIVFTNVNVLRDNMHRFIPNEIVVNVDVGIDEQLFQCCVIGTTYLMVLTERSSQYAPFFGGASFRVLRGVGGAAKFKAIKAH